MKFRNPQGQALVEMALSLLLLCTILFGITEFGRAMYMTNTLNNVARECARRASVANPPMNDATITALIIDNNLLPFDADGLGATIAYDPSPATNSTITVQVTLPFIPAVPLMQSFFPKDSPLRGQAAMRYEM